ncbi:MAG: YbjN domain-containing protein [Tepidisphaerales bacterium]
MVETTSELVARVMATVWRYMARSGWPVEQHAEGWISGTIHGDNGLREWIARCSSDGEFLWFCTYVPVYVPRRRRAAVAEYVTLANWGLQFGNFELGGTDGLVVFRTAVPLGGRCPSCATLSHQATASFWQMDWHLPGLMAVAHGKVSPKRALRRVERERQIARDRARAAAPETAPAESPDAAASPASNTSEPNLMDERRKRWFTSEN